MSLYIGRLSSRTRGDELECVFRRFGRCNVRLKGGYGFVVYDYPSNAEKALRALQGRNICGEPLTLTWSNKQPRCFKKFARADQSYDHEPLRVRSSAGGGDYGNRKLDLNVQQDYNMSIEQLDGHGVRLNSPDLLNAEVDYHQSHFKVYTGEDNHNYGEDLLNEGGEVEPNLIDGDRWDGQHYDRSNGNDVERDMEFDRYIGYDRNDDNENPQIVYPSSSPAAQSPQEKIARELIGEGTMNHPEDSKAHQTCYSCGALGHKKHNCPRGNNSGSRFDRKHDNDTGKGGRGQGGLASFGSSSRAKMRQDKDPVRKKQFKDTGKASASVMYRRLIENGNSLVAKETDRAWEKDYGGKKRGRRGGTPKTHSAKKAKPISSPHCPDYGGSRSRSKSRSIKHMPRSISLSRSRSISSRAQSSSNNLRSSSHYSRSRSSKSSSRSSTPTSLSLSVSLGRPLPSSPNKGQLNAKGTSGKSNSPESKEIMVGGEPAEGDFDLENAKFENRVAPVNIENAGTSGKVENEVEKDQAMQRGNSDNHMTPRSVAQVKNSSTPLSERGALASGSLSPESLREIKGGQDFDALTTEDVIVAPVKTDSELTCGSLISLEELCMVMKHYGLEPPDENERHQSAEAYFGSARLWPWQIVYYRRLKKGPISTENYARRVAQNEEFGIVDKYIRSSSGWGELNHP